ncbi:hypothetical protein PIB30_059794 [Stylosanthes scabra]|uniref:Small auxin up regulated protein n=1 Tax=Stylosanthes scabra TaxID=79078 RepID=A0ABU6VLC2_9FABA|nr:hypothetical protein [Stylosanthes scabra]
MGFYIPSIRKASSSAAPIRYLAVYIGENMRRVLSAKHILRRQVSATSMEVPKGYFAVYVGEGEKKRFVIPVSVLNQPSFQELLSIAENEFGFSHPMGGLTIPCSEDVFMSLTSTLC